MPLPDHLICDNRFTTLPSDFYTRVDATPLTNPYLVGVSDAASALIGVSRSHFSDADALAQWTGAATIPGSQPLAAVYSGHQFGVWAGQLGDGRALLLGDVAGHSQEPGWQRIELQLKGAGMTPYSRMGDGRAVLRSSIREFLCSEAMHGLGVPTTRALCVIGSDLAVMREQPETTAIVVRMAPDFLRFGSFEHWYYEGQHGHLRALADYVITHHYPHLRQLDQPYAALLAEVTRRTARLVAHWQALGFMHGVMNTDNMSILGLTLDYGPFGFMEAFDAKHICNHSDHSGRYAYSMQPRIAHWNCYALGQAMVPLIGDPEGVHQALSEFGAVYGEALDQHLHAKLGLQTRAEHDAGFIDDLFQLLQSQHVDYPQFFRRLSHVSVSNQQRDEPVRELFIDPTAFDAWALKYRDRLLQENSEDAVRRGIMLGCNPKYVLRNYLAQVAIERAQQGDFTEVERLQNLLAKPYDEQPEYENYAKLPPDWASKLEVSCSS